MTYDPRINAEIKPITVESSDGVSLRAYICGTGPNKWLLTPGLGTPLLCWKYLFERFGDKMTIVTWEPRGCYSSTRPNDMTRVEVADHVQDGLAVMKAVGWEKEKFLCGGWSMGIEIALELYDLIPKQIKGLVLINGAFERVLSTAFSFIPNPDKTLGCVLRGMTKASVVFAPFSSWALGQKWAIALLKKMRIVTANEEFFGEVAGEFRNLDFGFYFPMILGLSAHSARHILPKVKVPTLITAGDADAMTPLSAAREMQSLIEGSELFVVPDGTHYTTMEYPDIINAKIEEFIKEKIYKTTWK